VIPAIKQQLYTEAVNRGHFARSPESTRNTWMFGGIGVLILASVLFWGARGLTSISPLIMLPPVGLGVFGAAAALAANYMPAKTAKGSQEAARWRAFRHYLDNIERYGDIEQAAQQFDRSIGYAVTFGLEQEWIRKCSSALTQMPTWYFPTHLGGPWGSGYYRGYRPGSAGSAGGSMPDFNLGGPGGLNEMSRGMTEGLNSMSSGLTRMLNDASRAMTTAPKSSGSGGRGGFSGGGGGGGGGSGGGSRGFG
jgi:uncharacterized membrane protein YgcG